MPRIGQGFDVHRLVAGDGIRIGGVLIPCEFSLLAHSDGDVLLHALCDALLGALALGDIGKHFPDTDPRYAGVDSRELLRQVRRLLRDRGHVVGNVDMTIIAQAPRMAPHIDAMREVIATDLKITPAQVGVKATTSEGLGYTGRGEGIAAQAVALLLPVSEEVAVNDNV